MLSATAAGASAMSLGELGRKMTAIGCYADSAVYEVLLPNFSEPVRYSLGLESAPAAGDTLAACRYFVGWQLPAPSGISEGFIAYFDGTHYRMRDRRLQEYHYEWAPEVFAPGGDVSRGVQCQAQFAELLPQNLGQRFIQMEGDSTYIYTVVADTVVGGSRSVVVDGVRRAAGYDGMEYTYIIDAATLLPRRMEFENNPGQLGEQSITVEYSGADTADRVIDEASVVQRRPEAFEKYRESTFSLKSLPGSPLPRIASRTTTGERYLHERGEAFAVPTLVAFVDAEVGSTPDLVGAVRRAVDALPYQVDVVWAFLNHRVDDIEAVVPQIRAGEHLLVSARAAARDCGVGTVTPVLLFVSPDGTVADYMVGYNPDLASLVIQKASIASKQ